MPKTRNPNPMYAESALNTGPTEPTTSKNTTSQCLKNVRDPNPMYTQNAKNNERPYPQDYEKLSTTSKQPTQDQNTRPSPTPQSSDNPCLQPYANTQLKDDDITTNTSSSHGDACLQLCTEFEVAQKDDGYDEDDAILRQYEARPYEEDDDDIGPGVSSESNTATKNGHTADIDYDSADCEPYAVTYTCENSTYMTAPESSLEKTKQSKECSTNQKEARNDSYNDTNIGREWLTGNVKTSMSGKTNGNKNTHQHSQHRLNMKAFDPNTIYAADCESSISDAGTSSSISDDSNTSTRHHPQSVSHPDPKDLFNAMRPNPTYVHNVHGNFVCGNILFQSFIACSVRHTPMTHILT
uniref:Uncharacterized protein n=1 Tax=Branchiostoma floridae TaxID=7739 RepID=C3Z153_BRAFL|eukprot:XP_002597740.1 hypothetical protein BRAFLDRAFT_77357 [Branchiostoma floridae]